MPRKHRNVKNIKLGPGVHRTHPNRREDPDEDGRENFRIAQCCGNCEYYYYVGNSARRGICWKGTPRAEFRADVKQYSTPKEKQHEIVLKKYKPAHTATVCGDWQIKRWGSRGGMQEAIWIWTAATRIDGIDF